MHGQIPTRNLEKQVYGFNIDIEDPERGFSPYLERRGLPVVYPTLGEKEDDDDLHCPDVNENVPLSWKALIVFLFVGGLLTMFVGWPILTYMREGRSESSGPAELSQHVFPILKAARPLIDPDTPEYALTRKSVLGQGELKLVFSDEFNEDGRTFYENEDQFWQAADLHYASTQDLEWYDPDQITTKNGTLQLQLIARRNHDLDYQSGMLGSWNKLCFKGGIMEVSASLAGPGGTPGLWPGIWTLGNLARPGYRATTDGVWPYSYDNCDAGITPNQSSFDGISFLPGQRLPNCVCRGEDHPNSGVGRGAPEIDALEGTAEYDMKLGLITQSSQVAPFDIWYQTDANFIGLTGEFTQMNSWMGGPFQQAISVESTLYQKYAFEYIPGKEDGMIAWFVGDDETFRMSGKATGPNGNVGQRDVTQEPMSIILNLGISTSWVWIDWPNIAPRLIEGTTLHIDYVRIYQKEGEELITCDPPGYPTTQYIRDHPEPYNNPNLTMWSQTGYPWPKNQLMDDCE
ncbi:beta-glucan synthesis-associated [Geopyxis carbonaria]|nr:beta-glucan synthesis-associated [Geopyxis carbonaria]